MDELRKAIAKFREAADGDSNDAEHDAAVELADLAESIRPQFTGDELATILHSLRIIQEVRQLGATGDIYNCTHWEQRLTRFSGDKKRAFSDDEPFSCDHFGDDWTPLSDAQIDALCAKRINPLDADSTILPAAEIRDFLELVVAGNTEFDVIEEQAARLLYWTKYGKPQPPTCTEPETA